MILIVPDVFKVLLSPVLFSFNNDMLGPKPYSLALCTNPRKPLGKARYRGPSTSFNGTGEKLWQQTRTQHPFCLGISQGLQQDPEQGTDFEALTREAAGKLCGEGRHAAGPAG